MKKMICPMKFRVLSFSEEKNQEFYKNIECDKENCAWYCKYSNNQGECVVRSLSSIFYGINNVAKIIDKKNDFL